ncbi:MAG: Ig-like domain-containing protein, partial [Roseiflexaceae bacterium]|nr:Ig-like domain-containing protein [Roseiflexaceae bacterium]
MPQSPTPGLTTINELPAAQSPAPTLIQRVPERGEELRPDGALALVFNVPMDKPSVEAALSLQPAVGGSMSWPDARTLVFTPDAALPRAAQYAVALSGEARAQDGAKLAEALRFQVITSGFLEVGQVVPADGAADIAPSSTITVMFSRPVVPLTGVAQQAALPQPLTFEPPVVGTGNWLSTAIYSFTPAQPLQGGTSYRVDLAADLRDAQGNPMQRGFGWTFSTARPQVLTISPQDGASGVSVEPTIRVQFNQLLAADAGQSVLLRGQDGASVPVVASVAADTLVLTPTARLAFDSSYRLELAAGLGGGGGGQGMAQPFAASFRTAPLPRILNTDPADGAQAVPPWASFSIRFSAPIDPATVMPNLVFTPELSATQVYTYYDEFNNTFALGMGERPSTDFRVQIGPNIADAFGNTTGQTLDVRFRTAPLPPAVYLTSQGIGTYSAGRPARVGIMATNYARTALRLYRLPADALQAPLWRLYEGLPPGATLLRDWEIALDAPLDTPTLRQIDLLENGGALEPGMYVVELPIQGGVQRQAMIVSPINLTVKSALGEVLVWANDMQTGAPVANLILDIYEETDQIRQLGSSTTNGDGLARLSLQRQQENGLIAVAREPFAAMSTSWATSIARWEFASSGQFYAPGLYSYVYTDRPIYRPGQTVQLKGIIRSENDAAFTLPAQARASVMVQDPTGAVVFDQQLNASQSGTFNAELQLAEGAALGDYQINTQLGDRSFAASFRVAAYRPPEFEVTVAAPTQALRGQPTNASVAVAYLFGGPVANAPVTWNVLAEPYRFAPEWAGRYTFGQQNASWRCWECWWQPPEPAMPILNGTGTTDAQGQLALAIPADALDRLPSGGQPAADISGPYTLTVEAVATGRDNQDIAGRSSLTVHPAELYAGLAAQSYLGSAGRAQQIDVVTAASDGSPLAGQTVELAFQRVTWSSNLVDDAQGQRWESSEQIEPLGLQTVTTDGSAQASASFTPDSGGAYRVVATVRDAGGRVSRTTLAFYVAGAEDVPWLRDNTERITLIADKASYRPGETASVLIPSPFQGEHWALITVERAGVRSSEVRRVEQNSIVFQLPISAADAPNIYLAVALFQGEQAALERGLADFKTGVLPITVETSAQQLDISVTPSAPQAEPGATVAYDLEVRDADGNPIAAELSLDLVDKGVLSLAPRGENAILEAFYQKRGLGVTTGSGVSISGDRLNAQIDQAMGRGGGMAAGSEMMPAPEATPAPASAAPTLGDDAASKASPQAAGPSVRENFADTAYWNPTVASDAAGRARIELVLPDNLTTWVLRAVGASSETQVGEGLAELVASKPLLIRPVTPRFFTVGDTAELAANISNNTDAPLSAQVALAATGLSVTGELTQTVNIPARGEAQVTWIATAQDVSAADLVFSAVAGDYADASRPRLATAPEGGIPVYRYSAPEVVGTGGVLAAA